MKRLILHFFILILGVLFDLALDTVYKHSRLFKTLLEKSFKFISDEGVNFISFLLCFVLLLSKVDPISKK